jgi:hypothetical protein
MVSSKKYFARKPAGRNGSSESKPLLLPRPEVHSVSELVRYAVRNEIIEP